MSFFLLIEVLVLYLVDAFTFILIVINLFHLPQKS